MQSPLQWNMSASLIGCNLLSSSIQTENKVILQACEKIPSVTRFCFEGDLQNFCQGALLSFTI